MGFKKELKLREHSTPGRGRRITHPSNPRAVSGAAAAAGRAQGSTCPRDRRGELALQAAL